ncbi:MAG: sugar ABC transporter substrate-binding protein [Longimicrobiales bacterium]
MLSRLRVATTLLLASIVFGGCGGEPGEVTLKFWGLGREGEVVAELVREFERENPGIRVDVQQIPWIAAHEKLLTAYVGDVSPDVAQIGNTWISEFVALDALQPLDRGPHATHVAWGEGSLAAGSDAVVRDGFFDGIWDTNVIEGRTYGIPWYVDTRLLFYRTDLLAEAGYTVPPRTWTGWVKAMRRIKARSGGEDYAIYLPTNEWNVPVILGMQAGSSLLRDDGRYGAFSEPAFARAFQFYVDLFKSELSPVMRLNVSNVYQEFARGRFAFFVTGPWNIGEFRRRLPPAMQDRWSTAPMPGPEGESSGVSMAGGASLVLFRSSRHKPEAWKLIEFLSRPDQQLRFFQLTGSLPARREAWQDSALIGDAQVRAFFEQLERVEPLPKVPEWELIATKVLDYAERAIGTNASTEQVLEALDDEVDLILEKRRWMIARGGR